MSMGVKEEAAGSEAYAEVKSRGDGMSSSNTEVTSSEGDAVASMGFTVVPYNVEPSWPT
jgi:hypothetical protein